MQRPFVPSHMEGLAKTARSKCNMMHDLDRIRIPVELAKGISQYPDRNVGYARPGVPDFPALLH